MALAKQNTQAKAKAKTPARTTAKKTTKNLRTEVIPEWDNEAPNLTADEQEAELARIKELMKDLK